MYGASGGRTRPTEAVRRGYGPTVLRGRECKQLSQVSEPLVVKRLKGLCNSF